MSHKLVFFIWLMEQEFFPWTYNRNPWCTGPISTNRSCQDAHWRVIYKSVQTINLKFKHSLVCGFEICSRKVWNKNLHLFWDQSVSRKAGFSQFVPTFFSMAQEPLIAFEICLFQIKEGYETYQNQLFDLKLSFVRVCFFAYSIDFNVDVSRNYWFHGRGVASQSSATMTPLRLRPRDMQHFEPKIIWYLPSLAPCEVLLITSHFTCTKSLEKANIFASGTERGWASLQSKASFYSDMGFSNNAIFRRLITFEARL